jgi:hypothetical protein
MAQLAQPELPLEFAVRKPWKGRHGYILLRWYNGGTIPGNPNLIVHALHAGRHRDHFYNLALNNFIPGQVFNQIQTKKAQGHVIRPNGWRHTGRSLVYTNANQRIEYPLIVLADIGTNSIPAINDHSFLPLVNQPVPAAPANVPAVAHAPHVPNPALIPPHAQVPIVVNQNAKPNYAITELPQHAIRAILRDAAMHEETCAITGEEIDVANGAVTSCFHLFEKNAIATWLAMPNSRDKCPVCSTRCNSYTLNDTA